MDICIFHFLIAKLSLYIRYLSQCNLKFCSKASDVIPGSQKVAKPQFLRNMNVMNCDINLSGWFLLHRMRLCGGISESCVGAWLYSEEGQLIS